MAKKIPEKDFSFETDQAGWGGAALKAATGKRTMPRVKAAGERQSRGRTPGPLNRREVCGWTRMPQSTTGCLSAALGERSYPLSTWTLTKAPQKRKQLTGWNNTNSSTQSTVFQQVCSACRQTAYWLIFTPPAPPPAPRQVQQGEMTCKRPPSTSMPLAPQYLAPGYHLYFLVRSCPAPERTQRLAWCVYLHANTPPTVCLPLLPDRGNSFLQSKYLKWRPSQPCTASPSWFIKALLFSLVISGISLLARVSGRPWESRESIRLSSRGTVHRKYQIQTSPSFEGMMRTHLLLNTPFYGPSTDQKACCNHYSLAIKWWHNTRCWKLVLLELVFAFCYFQLLKYFDIQKNQTEFLYNFT